MLQLQCKRWPTSKLSIWGSLYKPMSHARGARARRRATSRVVSRLALFTSVGELARRLWKRQKIITKSGESWTRGEYETLKFSENWDYLSWSWEFNYYSVKFSGGSREGFGVAPLLIFRPKWGPKGRKKNFWVRENVTWRLLSRHRMVATLTGRRKILARIFCGERSTLKMVRTDKYEK